MPDLSFKVFEEFQYCFDIMVVLAYTSTSSVHDSLFSTYLTNAYYILLGNGHCNWSEMMSHFGFDLHFSGY
jgi:hypothetical protein